MRSRFIVGSILIAALLLLTPGVRAQDLDALDFRGPVTPAAALAPEAASSLLLPLTIGHQRAFEVFALGEPIDGRTALAWGLASRAVPAAEVDAETFEGSA